MGDLDESVLSFLGAGDAARALTEALRKLGPEVFGFLVGALGNDADADEVFSMWSVALWRSLGRFQGRCSLRTWTYVLARHEIGRFRKGAQRHVAGRVPISELKDVLVAART